MTLLKARIVGATEVSARLEVQIPETMRERLGATIRRLGLSLERKVKLEKLEGQVLHRRSGRLVRSVNTRYRETKGRFESSTGTKLVYGRAWELGFYVPARIIVPRHAKALYWPGARHPVRKVMQKARTVPARPWLTPALAEMDSLVRDELRLALRDL